ncbi:hypothetical protein BLX42_01245 [Pseudomonas sp. SG-MS2]|jgi:hypothetical protein|uniref:DUF2955 domain-containing protein n=1 Tax=Pseudomonas putida TaxID=303 RepID=A0A7Y7Z7R0_PSEPU|nr:MULTISPECIES: DUF2955 domain-containing protein [Pseudomonas]KAF1312865.1 hypothetical protein BLX42_01245 [Pseudomonas sp. SG-MS2]MBM7397805.1 uncharacterized membrane protein YgaE (UPF0421/DUF939 family) [Pseudomonas sp. M5]NWC79363.1 DUF2955 domain-containing protein [Pseudomonas putida]HDS1757856.1 DUF2955 domain-containing protein [Pseudomonas putida]
MPIELRRLRALRLALGVALCLVASFGLGLPVPILAPVFAVLLLAMRSEPLPIKAAPMLAILVLLSCGSGLLLIPLLRHAPVSGVLLVGVGVFLVLRYALKGGNGLLANLLVVGLTMIAAAGTSDFTLALMVVEAMAKGMLLAVLGTALAHVLVPEPADAPAQPAPPLPDRADVGWIALRATLIVMPAFLLALIAPDAFMPLIMKAVSLGQQAGETRARHASRELIGSTVLAGVLAMLMWAALSVFVHVWMFFLWVLLFTLWQGRRLYRVVSTRHSPAYWVSCLTTLLILLGQSVQDSAAGQDVYRAFAVRMALFLAVSLYASALLIWLDRRRLSAV